MNPTIIEGNNTVLTKPDNMTDEQCQPLAVRVARDEHGFICLQSAWQPTLEELGLLNQGKPVVSLDHPPVWLEVL